MAEIPAVQIDSELLNTYQETMRKGACSLKFLSDLTGIEPKLLRSRIFKNPQFSQTTWPELAPQHVEVFLQVLPAIQALRQIEWKIVCAFSRLARKQAVVWAKRSTGVTTDYEDFEQEALMALLDAIYTYDKTDAAFITYAWWCIRNRLATVANRNNALGPFTNEVLKLMRRFDECKTKANCHICDVEVYRQCGFTEDEIVTLEEARVRVYGSPTADDGTDVEGDDYTGQRKGIDNEKDTVPCNFEVLEAVKRAKLNDLERKIINTYLSPHYGWQTELAAKTINPVSGKPYTKARIQQLLQIALKKVKSAYLRRHVA